MISVPATSAKHNISLPDGSKYFYSIHKTEITNSLNTVVATADAYTIFGDNGDQYTLHKTEEGTWYVMPELVSGKNMQLIRELKKAIDAVVTL